MKQIIYKLDKLLKKIILLVFVHLINLLNQSGNSDKLSEDF